MLKLSASCPFPRSTHVGQYFVCPRCSVPWTARQTSVGIVWVRPSDSTYFCTRPNEAIAVEDVVPHAPVDFDTVVAAARAFYITRQQVVDWMKAQTTLRTNDESPYWAEYKEAEAKLNRVMRSLAGDLIT